MIKKARISENPNNHHSSNKIIGGFSKFSERNINPVTTRNNPSLTVRQKSSVADEKGISSYKSFPWMKVLTSARLW